MALRVLSPWTKQRSVCGLGGPTDSDKGNLRQNAWQYAPQSVAVHADLVGDGFHFKLDRVPSNSYLLRFKFRWQIRTLEGFCSLADDSEPYYDIAAGLYFSFFGCDPLPTCNIGPAPSSQFRTQYFGDAAWHLTRIETAALGALILNRIEWI